MKDEAWSAAMTPCASMRRGASWQEASLICPSGLTQFNSAHTARDVVARAVPGIIGDTADELDLILAEGPAAVTQRARRSRFGSDADGGA